MGPIAWLFYYRTLCEQCYLCYDLLSPQASAGLLSQVSWGWCPICLSLSPVSFDPWLKKDEGLLQQRLQILSPAASTYVE